MRGFGGFMGIRIIKKGTISQETFCMMGWIGLGMIIVRGGARECVESV